MIAGMRLLGADGQKLGLELIALANVDRLDLVGNARFFAEDRDLVPVGCRPVVEFDRLLRHAMNLEKDVRWKQKDAGRAGALRAAGG